MSILGTFALAQRFCGLEERAPASPSSQELRPPDKRANAAPFQAALLTLFTPIFLVSATTIMCDVMMLGARILAGGPGSATMVAFSGFSGTDFCRRPYEILRNRASAAARRLYSGPGSPIRDLPCIPSHPAGRNFEL